MSAPSLATAPPALRAPGAETGGQLVAALAQLRTHAGDKPDLALTTNGLGLDRRAAQLRSAGLDRVNVSLDSIDASVYATTTRRDRFADALRGIQTAAMVGLNPIKVNAVAMADTIEQVAPSLLDKSLREGWQLRFIEHMPLGAQAWSRQAIVSAQRILDIFAANGFELTELGRPDRRPAQLWQVAPTATRPGGTVGIIASITRPFCDDCDRTRLTAAAIAELGIQVGTSLFAVIKATAITLEAR